MNLKTLSPRKSALIGLLLTSPFILFDAIVIARIEPFFSLIRPDADTSMSEYLMLFFALLLFPIGLFFVVRPMLERDQNGRYTFYTFNVIAAVIILVLMILLWAGFSSDTISCDILKVITCD